MIAPANQKAGHTHESQSQAEGADDRHETSGGDGQPARLARKDYVSTAFGIVDGHSVLPGQSDSDYLGRHTLTNDPISSSGSPINPNGPRVGELVVAYVSSIVDWFWDLTTKTSASGN